MFRILFLFFTLSISAQTSKVYQKNKDIAGRLVSEGWIIDGKKSKYWITYYKDNSVASKGHFQQGLKEKYWYFYRTNGNLEKEGHYAKGLMSDWWVFYDVSENMICKIQFKAGKKEGYCLQYSSGKIVKIEKFKADIKVGEWDDLDSFQKENDLKDLM